MSESIAALCGPCDLLTTDNSKVMPKEEIPYNKTINRHEIATLDYRRILSWINTNKQGSVNFAENKKKGSLISLLIKVQRSFPFNIFLGEGGPLYIICGYLAGKKIIREHKTGVICSSFMPYADHIIACLLKKKFPYLVWVADFRDLHVEPIYKNTIWPDFQKKVEEYILRRADIVTTVSDGLLSKMKLIHPNVHTITKGVQLRYPKEQFEKFTINYSGSLFQDFRDPRPLFRALNALIKSGKISASTIRIQYAGKDGGKMNKWATDCGVDNIFISAGMVPRQQALELQDKAHINLLLTSSSNEHSGLLTGKLFEYIESGREILCLINGTKDSEIEAIFSRYNLGSVLYNESEVEEYIFEKFKEWRATGSVQSHHNRVEIIKEMSWKKQAQRVLNLVDEAMASKQGDSSRS